MTPNARAGGDDREIVLPGLGTAKPIYRETFANVRVTGAGHIFKHCWPLKDHDKRSRSARILGLRWSSLRDAYLKSTPALLRPAKREAEAYWVTDKESTNYWHWFFEALPKLVIIADRDKSALVLMPHSLEKTDYVHDAIRFLGLENVRFIPRTHSVQVGRLWQMTKSQYHPEMLMRVRDLVLAHFPRHEGPANVYISRNDAGKRRVLNEAEDLRPLLDARGFETLEMSKLSFAQQVGAMRGCSTLMSMHGAGLTNMLFMPRGGSVIEFRTNNSCFVTLAEALGLQHIAIHGTKTTERSDHHADWTIRPSDVEAALARVGQPDPAT